MTIATSFAPFTLASSSTREAAAFRTAAQDRIIRYLDDVMQGEDPRSPSARQRRDIVADGLSNPRLRATSFSCAAQNPNWTVPRRWILHSIVLGLPRWEVGSDWA